MGLSQTAFSQNFKFVGEIFQNPIQSITVKYGERNEYGITFPNSEKRDGCSFDVEVQKFCNFFVLKIVNCTDCKTICWNGTQYVNEFLVKDPGTNTVVVSGENCQSEAKITLDKANLKTDFWVNQLKSACPGEKGILEIVLTNTNSNNPTLVSYQWSNGATTSSINVPKGIYLVTATNSYGCSSENQGQVTEFLPSSPPMVTPIINSDGTVTLISNMPSGNMWSNGATSQSIKPEVSGIYTLKVKDQNGCYSASSCPSAVAVTTKTVVVYDTVIVNSPLSCPLMASFMHEVNGKIVSFKNTSAGDPTAQIWWFGDGTNSNELNPVHTYANDGNYTVTLVIFEGQNQSTVTSKVFINTKTGNGGGGNVACPAMASFMYQLDDMNVYFKNTSSGDGLLSYLWDFGDNTSSSEKNPIHKYNQYGTYKVTLYVYTVAGFISASQMIYVVNQGVLNGTVCDSTLIKASNGMKNGEAILPSQISSQTKLVLEHPGARDWSWSPTGQATNWSLAKYNVGKHHFYVSYFVNNQKQCSVFDYEILGGGLTDTDDAENRSSKEDKGDINIYPNPTSGPVEVDLSGLPTGTYLINVQDQTGRQVTKKVIKQ